MKKTNLFKLLFVLFLNTPILLKAEVPAQFEILGKIKIHQDQIEFTQTTDHAVIPSLLHNVKVKKIITDLDPSDETIVKGHVIYQKLESDGRDQLRPVFVIESVTPISLKRIGDIGNVQEYSKEPNLSMNHKEVFEPWAIPVTTEVASAITMTTAMLLMQSLTASPLQPQGIQQMNSGMIFFAGALMTGAFIYEQITKKQALK